MTGASTSPTRPPQPGRSGFGRFASRLALSFAGMAGGGLVALAVFSGMAGAWTLAQLALASAVLAVTPALAFGGRRARRVALGLAVAALGRLAIAARPSTASARPGSPVETWSLDGRDAHPWFAGVPERELVALGMLVGTSKDEYEQSLDRGKRGLARYDALEAAPILARDESVLFDSWLVDRELFWLERTPGGTADPLIIFLHGNGGSFQFYPEWLGGAARARGIATAYPASGLGLWPRGSGPPLVARVLDRVQQVLPSPSRRVIVAGLSGGTPAALETVAAAPQGFRGLVLLSGIPGARLDLSKMREVPVLFVHGARDPRAAIGDMRALAHDLEAAGARVTFHEIAGADHFALLTHEREVLDVLLEFAQSCF